MTAEGLLMTPRRTETDGFFVSVLLRRAEARRQGAKRDGDHRDGVVSNSVSVLTDYRQAAHNGLKALRLTSRAS